MRRGGASSRRALANWTIRRELLRRAFALSLGAKLAVFVIIIVTIVILAKAFSNGVWLIARGSSLDAWFGP